MTIEHARYVLTYLCRRRLRASLTVLGMATSVMALTVTSGLAVWLDSQTSRVISSLLGDSSVLLTPPSGLAVDSASGLLVSHGELQSDAVDVVKNVSNAMVFTRITVGRATFNGLEVLVYADDRMPVNSGRVSSAVWDAGGSAWLEIQSPLDLSEAPELPGLSIVVGRPLGLRLIEDRKVGEWMVSATRIDAAWLDAVDAVPGVLVSEGGGFGDIPDLRMIVYSLRVSRARFDPFSFGAKFSAGVLNSQMNTLVGWFSRLVFAFGLVMAALSAKLGVRERRQEMAVFSIAGLQSEVSTMFLVENVVVHSTAFGLGAIAGLVIFTIGNGAMNGEILISTLGTMMSYLPVVVLTTSLVASQILARRSAIDILNNRL